MSGFDEVKVSKDEIDKLLKAHDGDVALLFLYLKLYGYDEDMAADALCRTGREISSAEEKLRRMGLLSNAPVIGSEGSSAKNTDQTKAVPKQIVEPADEMPEYTTEDILQRTKEESCFGDLIKETQRALGRTLSSADMKKLFGIYDYLGMSPDVIMILVNYCVEISTSKGDGRRPNMRYIEKVAFEWTRREINTYEKAEEFIKNEQQYKSIEAQVLREIGITDRAPTPSEKAYISEWVQKGFTPKAIGVAYDRTVTSTGQRAWKYMAAILDNWHKNGIHTVEEVNEKDGSSNRARAKAGANTSDKPASKQSGRDGLNALKKKMDNK